MNNENPAIQNQLGETIRRSRLAAGLSMAELARRTGTDRSTILRIETGELSEPSPRRLQRIASALGDEAEDYFALAGYATTSGMPTLGAYLRTKYDATPEMAAEVEDYFRYLQSRTEAERPDTKRRQH